MISEVNNFMMGVKHIHPSHHADSYIHSISGLDRDILHRAQNDIWSIVDFKSNEYPIILVAHQSSVNPPIVEIDAIKHTSLGEAPTSRQLDELINEFLGDKRDKYIHAPKDLKDNAIINALVRFDFLYDASLNLYTKVPFNY